MKTTFGEITQPHIRTTSSKKNKILLSLLMFYETRKILRKFSKC